METGKSKKIQYLSLALVVVSRLLLTNNSATIQLHRLLSFRISTCELTGASARDDRDGSIERLTVGLGNQVA